jgi:hypothetical protein
VSGMSWIWALDLANPMGLPGPPMPPTPPRRDRKKRPPNNTAGKMRLWTSSPIPLASWAGSTVTSTLCWVSCVNKSGSLGKASMATRTPLTSTPNNCVPSLLKVTFSMRSALTSLTKSLYRIEVGAFPYDWMAGTSVSDVEEGGGGASRAMRRPVVVEEDAADACRAYDWCWWGGAKASTPDCFSQLWASKARTARALNRMMMVLLLLRALIRQSVGHSVSQRPGGEKLWGLTTS